jgi:hypothetical protein
MLSCMPQYVVETQPIHFARFADKGFQGFPQKLSRSLQRKIEALDGGVAIKTILEVPGSPRFGASKAASKVVAVRKRC